MYTRARRMICMERRISPVFKQCMIAALEVENDETTIPHRRWVNTSSNSIIKEMIGRADRNMRGQL